MPFAEKLSNVDKAAECHFNRVSDVAARKRNVSSPFIKHLFFVSCHLASWISAQNVFPVSLSVFEFCQKILELLSVEPLHQCWQVIYNKVIHYCK